MAHELPSVPEQVMTMVVVFGGSGFLGRRLVHRLTAEGMTVRVAVRHPDPARVELRSIGLDRVTVVPADVRDQASVVAAIAGADAVVNAVSAYVEKAGVTFEAVHVQGAETLAQEAVAAGVARLVLVSGVGADPDSSSPYIRARGRGEQMVRQTFPEATIVRPGAGRQASLPSRPQCVLHRPQPERTLFGPNYSTTPRQGRTGAVMAEVRPAPFTTSVNWEVDIGSMGSVKVRRTRSKTRSIR
jgi:uncharacterized protein YbjT (DUF2867 family)